MVHKRGLHVDRGSKGSIPETEGVTVDTESYERKSINDY